MDIWSVALEFIKCVIPCISSDVGYIFSYKKNLQKLERHIEKLKETEDTIKHGVNDAERNGEKIFVIVQNWLKKANDIVIEAKKLTDIDGQAQAGCCMGKFPNPWKRNQLSQRFEEMIGEICEIMENGKFDRFSYSVASDVTISPFCRGYEALDSQTSMLNAIKQTLKDPEIYMIGVHGMGGVGKTTLVKELAWQVKKDGLFGAVAVADIIHSPNVKRIRGQIIDALLNRKLNEKESEIGRASELRQIIKQQERVLIILDDIWNRTELDLTKVEIPFGDEHNGCKLVVTSRDLNVLTKMGTQKEFNMGALQKKDSWNLFQRVAGDVVKEFNIKPIAEKVAKCCAGLPLLIVTIAKGLRKKDVTAWRDALIQLERFNHEELQKIVHPALELSYNYLEDDELKSLFLFIGSLGINFIHTGELFSCCWGLGFYSHMHTLIEARNRHFKLINDLRASSLLLNIPEWVRMHDVVRDVAKSIASRFHTTYSNKRLSKMKEWPWWISFTSVIILSFLLLIFLNCLRCWSSQN